MIEIQKIYFPADCEIIHHEFYNYEPATSFTEVNNLQYLNEDLLQCAFTEDEITIDLGWYGDAKTNKGGFQIQIIESENWEVPLNVIHSKSAEETKNFLNRILQPYTHTNEE